MKIYVTTECRHEDSGWTSKGAPFVGQHVVISRYGVCLDGDWVITRDRRAIKNREVGHPWLTSNNHPDPAYRNVPWTTFSVEVEP